MPSLYICENTPPINVIGQCGKSNPNRQVGDKTHGTNRFSRKSQARCGDWTVLNAISLFGLFFSRCTDSEWPAPLIHKTVSHTTLSKELEHTHVYTWSYPAPIRRFPTGFCMIARSPTGGATSSTPANQAISYFCIHNVHTRSQSDIATLAFSFISYSHRAGMLGTLRAQSSWTTSRALSVRRKGALARTPIPTLKFEQVIHTECFG